MPVTVVNSLCMKDFALSNSSNPLFAWKAVPWSVQTPSLPPGTATCDYISRLLARFVSQLGDNHPSCSTILNKGFFCSLLILVSTPGSAGNIKSTFWKQRWSRSSCESRGGGGADVEFHWGIRSGLGGSQDEEGCEELKIRWQRIEDKMARASLAGRILGCYQVLNIKDPESLGLRDVALVSIGAEGSSAQDC